MGCGDTSERAGPMRPHLSHKCFLAWTLSSSRCSEQAHLGQRARDDADFDFGEAGRAGCEVPTAGSPAQGTDLCADSRGVSPPTTAKVTMERMLLGGTGGRDAPTSKPEPGPPSAFQNLGPLGSCFQGEAGPRGLAGSQLPPPSHTRPEVTAGTRIPSGGCWAATLCQREAQSRIPRCQTKVSMREGGRGRRRWG